MKKGLTLQGEPATIGELVRQHVLESYRSQKEAALAWECSEAHLSAVVHGERRPTDAMLTSLGVKRVEVYVAMDRQIAGLPMRRTEK